MRPGFRTVGGRPSTPTCLFPPEGKDHFPQDDHGKSALKLSGRRDRRRGRREERGEGGGVGGRKNAGDGLRRNEFDGCDQI